MPSEPSSAAESPTGFYMRVLSRPFLAIACRLPGAVYLRQELTFLGAVKIGDTITARVEVMEVDTAKSRVKPLTTCDNQEGKRVLTGEAVVSPPRPLKTTV